MAKNETHDVLIVGGGPAGASCAYWLAKAGWDVLLADKATFPREKTCGDGLTPRAVRQLCDMGLEHELEKYHPIKGLKAWGYGRCLELNWPEHPLFPNYGYVMARKDLDLMVANNAVKQGAQFKQATQALQVLTNKQSGMGGIEVNGVLFKDKNTDTTQEIRARYVVIAQGANSNLARELGCTRDRSSPMGMALRGYFLPDNDQYRSNDNGQYDWIESHLDIQDGGGKAIPGYGWIFPMDDGRLNVGVGLLTVSKRYKGFNTTKLMESFLPSVPPYWGVSKNSACDAPMGGRLQMGLSITPRVGVSHLLIGDSVGAINPFNGEGISYAFETGRMAAEVLNEALSSKSSSPFILHEYEQNLINAYEAYYKIGKAFVNLISRPEIMRVLVANGMHSNKIMEEVLTVMANLLDPIKTGPAEFIYKLLSSATNLIGTPAH